MIGVVGIAERSSRGPEAVVIYVLSMPRGRGEGHGGFGVGACHWSVNGPKGILKLFR